MEAASRHLEQRRAPGNVAATARPRLFRPVTEEDHMATYIVLGQFTDQGIRNIKETTKRAEGVKAAAKKCKHCGSELPPPSVAK